jgi:LemA protein
MSGGVILLLILGVILLWLVVSYNGLVRMRLRVREAWAAIDVQLKRRYDLIPNLVNTAKGYLKHEREVLENVTRARQLAMAASGPREQAQADNQLTQTLRSLFAVVEAYPDLKANQTMASLMEELTSTENRVGFSRQHYNDSVLAYNTALQSLPTNIVGSVFSFQPSEFFQVEEAAERRAVKVEF